MPCISLGRSLQRHVGLPLIPGKQPHHRPGESWGRSRSISHLVTWVSSELARLPHQHHGSPRPESVRMRDQSDDDDPMSPGFPIIGGWQGTVPTVMSLATNGKHPGGSIRSVVVHTAKQSPTRRIQRLVPFSVQSSLVALRGRGYCKAVQQKNETSQRGR